MDRELPPGSRAAPPMRCGAFSRRAWKQVIGDILEHPWRWLFRGVGLVSVLYWFVAATIRALDEPWHGSYDQWSTAVFVVLALSLAIVILNLAFAWRREIAILPTEVKWRQPIWLAAWVAAPIIFIIAIIVLILRG